MGIIADKIRQAIYGKDVRDSIAQGIEVTEQLRVDYDQQVINAGNSNAEIVAARSGEVSLPVKIGKIDSDLSDKANITDVTSQIAQSQKVIVNYNGSLTTLIADGTVNIAKNYLILDTLDTTNYGYVCTHNGTTWVKGWLYQAYGIADNEVTTAKVLDNAITDNKLSLDLQKNYLNKSSNVWCGKNKFNASKLSKLGWWCNYSNGAIESTQYTTNFRYSEPIWVSPNNWYRRINGADGTVFLDVNLNFISGTQAAYFMTPANTRYVIMNVTDDKMNEQLEWGRRITTYEPYQIKFELPVTGKNKFDNSKMSSLGWWWNYASGIIEATQYTKTYQYSYPILISPNTDYVRKNGASGTVFLTNDLQFISGVTTNSFTTPATAKYVVLNVDTDKLNYEQLELGTIATSYEKYTENPVTHNVSELNLPPKIYGLVGKEMNLYFDNLMIDNSEKYDFDLICAIGKQQNERYTVIPTTNGTSALGIETYKDKNPQPITRNDSNIVVASASSGSGLTKYYLQFGDSLTFNMFSAHGLKDNFATDVMSLVTLGTQNAPSNPCEGYPGKTSEWLFSNVASPFVFNGVFNFTQYMTTQGYTTLDFAGIFFGANDVFAITKDEDVEAMATTMITRYEAMITSMKVFNSNIKVGIMLPIPPAHDQDAFGADVGCGANTWRYKRNITILAKLLNKAFANRENELIYVLATNANLDTKHNFAYATEAPVNSRNPVDTVVRQTNALHPSYYGSWQLADTVYYWIKNMV